MIETLLDLTNYATDTRVASRKIGIKKFDICLMNPPYGTNESGNQGIHYEFVTKCNEITDRNIVVMPVRMIYATNNKFDIYKKEYNDVLLSLDEIDAKSFNIKVGSLGIYNFDNKNGNNNNINISLLNGENNNVKSLFEISLKKISKYEQEILNYLDNNGNVSYYVVGAAGKSGRNPDFIKSQYKRKFNENDVLLLTNYSYGKDNPIFMTSRTGQIFKAGEAEQCEYAMKGYRSVIMKFNTFKEAENCKIALNNPVIRFGLYKLKDCQDLSKRVRKYIPNIDWSDDRVKTDEGLLEVCGCPKNKCKEYAEYCKKIIEEVDKGNRP